MQRRSPAPGQRVRDAQRTRDRILRAAAEEFAARGFAGARVDTIATKAGANKQLIAYYFDGKEGLYRSLIGSWLQQKAEKPHEYKEYRDVIADVFQATMANPIPARVMLWQALEKGEYAKLDVSQDDRMRETLRDIGRRQQAGELSSDFDPGFILLILMSAISAPIALPHIVRLASAHAPSQAAFLDAYSKQLGRLFAKKRR